MKRIQVLAGLVLCLCMLLPLAAGTASGVEALSSPPVYGDVDGNGEVNIFDIVEVRNVIFGVTKPTASVTVTATPTPVSPTTDTCSPLTNSPTLTLTSATATPVSPTTDNCSPLTNSPTVTLASATATPDVTPSAPVTELPNYDEAMEFNVIGSASPFRIGVPSLLLAKSPQDLTDIYSTYYDPDSSWKPVVDEKYDEIYFENKYILLLERASDERVDQIWLKNNQLTVYGTQISPPPPWNIRDLLLIEVDNSKLKNLKSLTLHTIINYEWYRPA